MYPPGKDTFARTGFAEDQDGAVGGQNFARLFCQAANRCAGSYERVDGGTHFARFVGELLVQIALVFKDSLQDHQQSRKLEGLSEKLFSAFLYCTHCEVDGSVRSQDKQWNSGVNLLK